MWQRSKGLFLLDSVVMGRGRRSLLTPHHSGWPFKSQSSGRDLDSVLMRQQLVAGWYSFCRVVLRHAELRPCCA